VAQSVHGQNQSPRANVLDEIVVTATRVETNLQQTPMSIAAFTGEDLELSGIDSGRELGIMVPNVVINPTAVGEFNAKMVVRGLPGITTYVDGIWFGDFGFLQRRFVEIERVEVLRGPQGTLFGRNSNGGAIQVITRPPNAEFGARLDVQVGEFEERSLALAVDLPITDRLKSKWTVARAQNDGFMESQTAPFALGDSDYSLLRADFLWEPTDRLSLRFNINEEDRESTTARVIRNLNVQSHIPYNVLAGNPNFLAQARAINPAFPNPPFPLAGDRYTPESHVAGFPGGTLGKWETRTNINGPTVIDQQWIATTLTWDITDHWSLESLTSYRDQDGASTSDYQNSEFRIALDQGRGHSETLAQELHLTGSHFNDRLRTFLGLYYLHFEVWNRPYSWVNWEFAIPNTGPNPGTFGPPGVDGRPLWNLPAVNYVRSWGATVGNPAIANFLPFFTSFTTDRLFRGEDTDRALFGQVTIGLLEKLDLTLGFRFTEDDGSGGEYLPAEAFRPLEAGGIPPGDPFAVASVISETERAEVSTVSTPRVSIAYRPTDDMFLYASYAEGFTSGQIINDTRLPAPYEIDPEVVATKEIGLRSDWLDARLRFNATLFDSRWDGFRVPKTIDDPNNPILDIVIVTSDGVAQARGLELELFYLPGERWELDFALGLLDTEYVDIGDPPANGTGLQPGIPFAYAPETTYSLGARYRWPLGNGGELLFAGDYGWMDEYQRESASQNQTKNPDGSNNPEAAYGILNARVVYQPASRNWQLSLFGTNLTNEWYVNGGTDQSSLFGVDWGIIGRPREIGVGLKFVFE
jgi:iron complex outermembrane receptor protein